MIYLQHFHEAIGINIFFHWIGNGKNLA